MSNLYIYIILNFNIFQVKYKHYLYLQIHVQIKQYLFNAKIYVILFQLLALYIINYTFAFVLPLFNVFFAIIFAANTFFVSNYITS